MFVPKHFAGTSETRLHFVIAHHNVVLARERFQFLRVVDGQEIRPAALIGFRHHSGNVPGLHAFFRKGREEEVEGGILILVPIGKGHLHKGAVAIDHPLLLLLRAAGKLGAHGAPVEGVVEGHKILLTRAMLGQGVSLRQLDTVLRGLAARAHQEDPVFLGVR